MGDRVDGGEGKSVTRLYKHCLFVYEIVPPYIIQIFGGNGVFQEVNGIKTVMGWPGLPIDYRTEQSAPCKGQAAGRNIPGPTSCELNCSGRSCSEGHQHLSLDQSGLGRFPCAIVGGGLVRKRKLVGSLQNGMQWSWLLRCLGSIML
jgi:hypothetical protein